MRKLMVWIVAALAALTTASAQMTKWHGSYTGVTSAQITQATHGISSVYIGVVCKDSSGNKLDLDAVSWTVDSSTYEVDITFTNSFTGTVYLSGPWPSSDTSNSTDFQVTISGSNSSILEVCNQCATYIARRTYNSQTFTASGGGYLGWLSFTAPTVFVYFRENILTFGLDSSVCSGSGYNISANANVECPVSSMPTDSNVTALASAAISDGAFTSVTDLRPW
jgi:hypothetical protein